MLECMLHGDGIFVEGLALHFVDCNCISYCEWILRTVDRCLADMECLDMRKNWSAVWEVVLFG